MDNPTSEATPAPKGDKPTKAEREARKAQRAARRAQAQAQAQAGAEAANAEKAARKSPEQPPEQPPERAPDARPEARTVPDPAVDREKQHVTIRPTISRSRRRGRHIAVLLSFVIFVIGPAAVAGWYLYERAADQYASHVGFSVRTEETSTALESILGSTPLSNSSTADTDILYEFLQSQQLVAGIDAAVDLRTMWSKPGTTWVWPWDTETAGTDAGAGDPIFAYHGGTIEDLQRHWERKVRIAYDSNTSLLEIRVLAFDPHDAQTVATELFERSSAMINDLSAIAREDAIGYAREELTQVETRLKDARLAIQDFRNRTQIVDPTIQTQTQSGLVSALESQLAEAQIALGLLRENGVRDEDPRTIQAQRLIDVISRQLADERAKLGLDGGEISDGSRETVADIVGQYEALQVDLEFAQQAFTAARANFDSAQAEARRQTRYLAAHVRPTLAERAEYPQRAVILGGAVLFLFLAWSILVLVGYALRDRR